MGVPTTVLPCWTREQVAARIIAGDNIFILHDKLIRVPNSWLSAHPGGSLSIHHFTGRDATDEVEAFHSDPTLKRMLGYAIGTVSLGEEGWVPLLPPAHAGWIRKIGDDGQLHWHKESTELYSDEPSEESPSSQILLLAKADNPSACPSALTLEPAPTTLSLKQQSQHSAAYKQLHKRIADAGLYKCRYITGYGPEIVRLYVSCPYVLRLSLRLSTLCLFCISSIHPVQKCTRTSIICVCLSVLEVVFTNLILISRVGSDNMNRYSSLSIRRVSEVSSYDSLPS